jgi:hypothetical protein
VITETLYKNHDNEIDLELRADGEAVDITGVSKVLLEVGEVEIDSAIEPSSFDWTTNGANGQLTLDVARLTKITNLKASTYKAALTVYDATYPNGLVWDEFLIILKD